MALIDKWVWDKTKTQDNTLQLLVLLSVCKIWLAIFIWMHLLIIMAWWEVQLVIAMFCFNSASPNDAQVVIWELGGYDEIMN